MKIDGSLASLLLGGVLPQQHCVWFQTSPTSNPLWQPLPKSRKIYQKHWSWLSCSNLFRPLRRARVEQLRISSKLWVLKNPLPHTTFIVLSGSFNALRRYQHTYLGFLAAKLHNFTGPFTTTWDISFRNYTLQHFCVFVTTEYPCANIRICTISTKITLLKSVLLEQNIERISFDSQKFL